MLLILGVIVLLGLWMMRRLSVGGQPPRILSEVQEPAPHEPDRGRVSSLSGAVFGLAVGGLVIYWLVPQRVSLHDALALDRTMLSSAVLEQEALLAPATPTTRNRWAGVHPPAGGPARRVAAHHPR